MQPPSARTGHPILPRSIIFKCHTKHTQHSLSLNCSVEDLSIRGDFEGLVVRVLGPLFAPTVAVCFSFPFLALCASFWGFSFALCSCFLALSSAFFPLLFFLSLLYFLPLLPLLSFISASSCFFLSFSFSISKAAALVNRRARGGSPFRPEGVDT